MTLWKITLIKIKLQLNLYLNYDYKNQTIKKVKNFGGCRLKFKVKVNVYIKKKQSIS